MESESYRPSVVFDEPVFSVQRKASRHLPGKQDESRASTRSTVERRIIKDSDQCPLCVANDDPRKVPVHPNCHCDVITDSVETGVADPTSRLLEPLNSNLVEMVMSEDGDILPDIIQLNPETAAVLDADNVRWADLARWLEQMQPYLNDVNNYLAIVVDEDTDEAAAEVEAFIQTVAEDIEQLPQAIRNKDLWFAITKSVVF